MKKQIMLGTIALSFSLSLLSGCSGETNSAPSTTESQISSVNSSDTTLNKSSDSESVVEPSSSLRASNFEPVPTAEVVQNSEIRAEATLSPEVAAAAREVCEAQGASTPEHPVLEVSVGVAPVVTADARSAQAEATPASSSTQDTTSDEASSGRTSAAPVELVSREVEYVNCFSCNGSQSYRRMH